MFILPLCHKPTASRHAAGMFIARKFLHAHPYPLYPESMTNCMIKSLKSTWFMASKNRISKDGGRHMADPSKRRARNRKSRLKDIDDGQIFRTLKNMQVLSTNDRISFEDDWNDPHVWSTRASCGTLASFICLLFSNCVFFFFWRF